MTDIIYGFWDNKNKYVAYIGKNKNYNKNNNRIKNHYAPSRIDSQPFNRVLQSNKNHNRYTPFIFVSGNFSEEELDDLEREAIKNFGTYKYNNPHKSVFNFTEGGDGSSGWKANRKQKLNNSKSKTTTGFYLVTKKTNGCKQGFSYEYNYFDNNTKKTISSIDLYKLEQKVKSKKLDWFIVDEKKAEETLNFEKNKKYINHQNNSTGFLNVGKPIKKSCLQGFIYTYQYVENGKRKSISSIDLDKLQFKVESKNLPFKIVDMDKAVKTVEYELNKFLKQNIQK